MSDAKLNLKKGRERSLEKRHPWVFSGAVGGVEGVPLPGDTVEIVDARGQFLAWGAYSPFSKIRARVWSWKSDEVIGEEFFSGRVRQALALRERMMITENTNAYRLVHGESDGLPGLVVDRYGEVLVVQVLSAGMEKWKETIARILAEETGVTRVFERSDADVRKLEGLEEQVAPIIGSTPDPMVIEENGLKFRVDVRSGQKTGFFVDQRRNRQLLREWMPQGADVLNCFCYTGAFTVYALAGGAKSVLSVDSSADALEMGAENLRLNGMELAEVEWLEGDVFQLLRKFRDSRKSFDVIILDPPKFAPTAAQAERAARGYKDINLLAFKLLRPGGLLFTYSCSGGISPELFRKIVTGAALDAGVDAKIVAYMNQGADHPVALNFPEGTYLKGLVCMV